MSCRGCKHLKVHPDAAGRIIPRADRAYACTVEVPTPAVPACISKMHWKWTPVRSYMSPEDGEGCQFYENRIRP